MHRVPIEFYVINQVILAFWLVRAYDLLEDRCTIDFIITVFPLCIKIAVRFENLYNILRHWANEKTQKKSCQCVEQVRETRRKTVSFLGNDLEKKLELSQLAIEQD